MNVLLNYFLAGGLGILFHVFVVKIPSVKSRAKAANHPFSVLDYLKEDWTSLVGNMICVLMLIVGLDQLLDLKPAIAQYTKWLFFFVGIAGSSLFMHIFSIADRKIRKVIDVKTNIADGVVPPVNEKNKEGMIEIQKEGVETGQ